MNTKVIFGVPPVHAEQAEALIREANWGVWPDMILPHYFETKKKQGLKIYMSTDFIPWHYTPHSAPIVRLVEHCEIGDAFLVELYEDGTLGNTIGEWQDYVEKIVDLKA